MARAFRHGLLCWTYVSASSGASDQPCRPLAFTRSGARMQQCSPSNRTFGATTKSGVWRIHRAWKHVPFNLTKRVVVSENAYDLPPLTFALRVCNVDVKLGIAGRLQISVHSKFKNQLSVLQKKDWICCPRTGYFLKSTGAVETG